MAIRLDIHDRPYAGDDDLQAVCDVANTCDAIDKLDDSYDVDMLRLELNRPGSEPARDLRLWEDENGCLVAFGRLAIERDEESGEIGARLYFRVLPDMRKRGLEGQILDWAEGRVREVAHEKGWPARLHSNARDWDCYTREALEAHGYTPERYFFRMACSLDREFPEAQLPGGYKLAHVENDEMLQEWVAAFNQSFIDHWDHHPLTIEEARHWNDNPDYRPEQDLVALAPVGEIAAFCYCEIDKAMNERKRRNDGWIHLLGARRGHRNLGLGRAMLLAGLRRLQEDGADRAILGVDADNPTGALGLYERVGFERCYSSTVYGKSL